MIYALTAWAAVIAWMDWRQHRVPNALLILLLVPALLALILNHQGLLGAGLWTSLAGFVAGGLILLPGYAMGKMGAGDVKFAACLGLLLGWPSVLKMLLLFGLVLGATSALVLWLHRQSPEPGKYRIAAAPALAAGFASLLILKHLQWEFLE